jgi:formyltetrahydrofolate-dependent phosphoribosylglycinamide formyltransferase
VSDKPLQLAVLIGGGGTTLQNLIDVIAAGELNAQIKLVVGSRPNLAGLKRAADAKIMNFVVDRRQFEDCARFSKQVFSLCQDADVDLVCLAGWLCLLDVPPEFVGKTMNIHPALLPSFGGKGMYGQHVHEAVLAHGCKITGCTVHFVDNTYDSGPIILQRPCAVEEADTAQSLAARVFAEEKRAYPEAIRLFSEKRLKIDGRNVRVLSDTPPG